MYAGKQAYSSNISIHAPREGSDGWSHLRCRTHRPFQSTLPARGATYGYDPVRPGRRISIHAPREGSDGVELDDLPRHRDFNPRSPRGERRRPRRYAVLSKNFNPRSPRGERRGPKICCKLQKLFQLRRILINPIVISIHAPREGSDRLV